MVQKIGPVNFRLSAYFLPFKIRDANGTVTDDFTADATFDRVIQLYKFDADLRLLMILAIDRVEVAIRSSVTYHLAHNLGPFGYTAVANFTPFVPSPGAGISSTGFDHVHMMNRIRAEIDQSKEDFVRHYRSKYTLETHLPIWMLTELLSFGMLSKMTEGVKKGLRKQIAKDFGISQSQLASWLETLTYIRNICAHHSRLWNRELSLKPELLREWKEEGIPNSRIYCVFLLLEHIMRYASPRSKWRNMLINHLLDNPQINLATMGFPAKWKEMPPWNLSPVI